MVRIWQIPPKEKISSYAAPEVFKQHGLRILAKRTAEHHKTKTITTITTKSSYSFMFLYHSGRWNRDSWQQLGIQKFPLQMFWGLCPAFSPGLGKPVSPVLMSLSWRPSFVEPSHHLHCTPLAKCFRYVQQMLCVTRKTLVVRNFSGNILLNQILITSILLFMATKLIFPLKIIKNSPAICWGNFWWGNFPQGKSKNRISWCKCHSRPSPPPLFGYPFIKQPGVWQKF